MLMLKHLMQQVYSFVCLSTFLNNKRDTTIINFILLLQKFIFKMLQINHER
jgi:hypothetical protein